MKKILIINIAIFFLLFASIECFSWYKLYNKYKDEIKAHNNIMGKKPIIPMKYEKVVIPDEKFLLSGLRPVEHRDEKNDQ